MALHLFSGIGTALIEPNQFDSYHEHISPYPQVPCPLSRKVEQPFLEIANRTETWVALAMAFLGNVVLVRTTSIVFSLVHATNYQLTCKERLVSPRIASVVLCRPVMPS